MVKVIKPGKREKTYIKDTCVHCGSELAYELSDLFPVGYGDIYVTYRYTCPVCGLKNLTNLKVLSERVLTEEEFNDISSDTSKSGLELLMEQKKQEDSNGIHI